MGRLGYPARRLFHNTREALASIEELRANPALVELAMGAATYTKWNDAKDSDVLISPMTSAQYCRHACGRRVSSR